VTLTLSVLPEQFAICRLDANASLPSWLAQCRFFSVTRTPAELSIVAPQANVPQETRCETDWRCMMVEGKLDFSLTGIIASLATSLADAGISLFAVSTFDTDYLLVKSNKLLQAVQVLRQAGHYVNSEK